MPNHVVNELIFRGVDAAARKEILDALCNADGRVDFEVLIPLPLNMWWGNVGVRHEKAFKRTALNWCRDNWGTKWNAYHHRPTEQSEDTLILRFDTAWRPPYAWLAAVFNSLKRSFEHNWLDEGERGHHAIFNQSQVGNLAGDSWHEENADDEMQKHLHFLQWGCEAFAEDGEETDPAAP